MVTFLVRYSGRSGSDYTHCVSRHEDIRIGRLAASVQDNAVDPVCENEERTLGREHSDLRPGHFCDMVSPYACRIDSDRSPVFCIIAGLLVVNLHADNVGTFENEARDFRIYEDFSSVKFRIDNIGRTEPERVN